MSRLLLLHTKHTEGKLINYLKKTISPDIQIEDATYNDFVFEIGGSEMKVCVGNYKVSDYDFVWFRRGGNQTFLVAKALAYYLNFLKIPYFDSAWGKVGVRQGKLAQLVLLAIANLPIPLTIFCLRDKIQEEKRQIISRLGFPILAKEIWRSHGGSGVFLLNKQEDFDELLNKTPRNYHFIFQRFYQNDGDYRILVIKDKILAWEKRIRKKDKYRNNVALGGEEQFFPVSQISKNMAQIAIRAAKVLDLQVAGVDVIFDQKSGKMMILEVNRSPAFTTDPSISPELEAIADYFEKEVTKYG